MSREGNWTEHDGWHFQIFNVDEGDNFHLCYQSIDADDDGRACDYGGTLLEGSLVLESEEENRANANLISAAPDLYRAVSALLGLIDMVCHRDDIPPEIKDVLTTNHRIKEAKNAQRKARGEPPYLGE